jgi:hypothetical protein
VQLVACQHVAAHHGPRDAEGQGQLWHEGGADQGQRHHVSAHQRQRVHQGVPLRRQVLPGGVVGLEVGGGLEVVVVYIHMYIYIEGLLQ